MARSSSCAGARPGSGRLREIVDASGARLAVCIRYPQGGRANIVFEKDPAGFPDGLVQGGSLDLSCSVSGLEEATDREGTRQDVLVPDLVDGRRLEALNGGLQQESAVILRVHVGPRHL